MDRVAQADTQPIHLIAAALAIVTAAGQSSSRAVIVNLETAEWTHEKGAEPGSEGALLRADPTTGGIDLLVRFPSGHVIPAHFHDSNERIFVAEGELKLRREGGDAAIRAGGFAWLPADEIQRISCGARGRCTFYLSLGRQARLAPGEMSVAPLNPPVRAAAPWSAGSTQSNLPPPPPACPGAAARRSRSSVPRPCPPPAACRT